jgi:arylsulfatase A-like enzyme
MALAAALWTGLLFGLLEALNGTWRHRVEHLPTGEVVSGELFWYAPLAAGLSMVLVALLVVAIDRITGGRAAIRALIPGICFALGTYSLERAMSVGIGNVAAIILAAGVGTVVLRIVRRYPAGVSRLVRRTLPVMLALPVLWAIALPRIRHAEERRAIDALPAPPASAPNVLVIIWDTVRAMSTSLYGYHRETTPELAGLAARGTVFDRAFATSSWSLPSHGSLFTGQYPPEMTVGFRAPLDDTHLTIAEEMSRRGYATAGLTANLFYGSRDYGIARGFTWYDERPAFNWRVVTHTWWFSRFVLRKVREHRGVYQQILRRHAGDVNDAFFSWLDRRGDRPFFAVLNHFDAHEPYRPPAPFHTSYASPAARYWGADDAKELTPDVLRQLRDSYDGSIRYMDHELGRLLDELDRRGLLDNTLVIVTADHGEEFEEHGPELQGHAKSLYIAALQVPLVMAGPRVPSGVRVKETVSIRDIPATVVDLVRGDSASSGTEPFPGVSLARLARGDVTPADSGAARLVVGAKHRWAAQNPEWPTSAGDVFSVIRGDYHYIVNPGGREELYHFINDSTEQKNLASESGSEALLNGFRATLDSLAPVRDGVRAAQARRTSAP